MLSREQFTYLLSQTGKGLDVERVRGKWNNSFPLDIISAEDAIAYLAERRRLVENGVRPALANEQILTDGIASKPKLSITKRLKGKKG